MDTDKRIREYAEDSQSSGTGNTDWERLNGITEQVIGCAYTVSNGLGSGFLEKVYENALVYELLKQDLKVEQQFPVKVTYDGVSVGEFIADLLVEDAVIVELKCVAKLQNVHMAQCLNYLRATGKKLCLILNFQNPKLGIKRIISDS